MSKAYSMTALLLVAGLVAVGCGGIVQAGDSPCEKYNKYMEKYYKHMKEAQEEAQEGDWDDYYEEIAKANRDLAKANAYASVARGYRHPGGACNLTPNSGIGYYGARTVTPRYEARRYFDIGYMHGANGWNWRNSSRDFKIGYMHGRTGWGNFGGPRCLPRFRSGFGSWQYYSPRKTFGFSFGW